MKPKSIDGIIKKLIEEYDKIPAQPTEELLRAWLCEVIGAKAAPHTRIKYLKNTTLYVDIDTPVWLCELSMQKPRILSYLQERAGTQAITELVLQSGEVTP